MAAFVSSLKYQALLPGAVLLVALAPAALLGICMLGNLKPLVKPAQKSVQIGFPCPEPDANELRFSKEELDLMVLDMMDPKFAGLADIVSLQTYRRDSQLGIFWKMQALESRKARKESELMIANNFAELACLWKRYGVYDCAMKDRKKARICAEFEREKAFSIARQCARSGRYKDSKSTGLMRQIWNQLNSSSCQAETDAEAVHYLVAGMDCSGHDRVVCGVNR